MGTKPIMCEQKEDQWQYNQLYDDTEFNLEIWLI